MGYASAEMEHYVLDDSATVDDRLDRKGLLEEVVKHVTGCRTPQVVGVYGDWGSGKTSFLALLELALSGHCTVCESPTMPAENRPQSLDLPVVWFDAWRFQHEPQPVVALLQQIRREFSPGSRLWEDVSKNGRVAVESVLLALDGITSKIGVSAKHIREVGERDEAARFAAPLTTTAIQKQLEFAVETILKHVGRARTPNSNGDRRLIVIIDDLDRCEPEAAWNLLEGIKVFLHLKSTVFVLGVNDQVVVDRLATVAKEKSGAASAADPAFLAREYLEKICPARYHLRATTDCSELIAGVISAGSHGHFATQWVEWTCEFIPGNPRRIKTFVAVLRRFAAKGGAGETDDDAKRAFVLAYLYHFHPELYRLVQFRPGFIDDSLIPWATRGVTGPAFEHIRLVSPPLSGTREAEPRELGGFDPDRVRQNAFHIQPLLDGLTITENDLKRLLI